MDINWAAFVGVVIAAYVIPGPDFVLILRWAAKGRRAGVAAAVGAQLGLCCHMVVAAAGLSVVLARNPDVLTAVRVIGGLYLAYLGGRLILPTFRRAARAPEEDRQVSSRSAFAQGLLTNLTNPKAILFFAAVLPQFLHPGSGPIWLQIAVLGLVDVALGFLPWAVLVVLGVRLSALLRRDAVRRWWDRATGAVLGGVGVTVLARG